MAWMVRMVKRVTRAQLVQLAPGVKMVRTVERVTVVKMVQLVLVENRVCKVQLV
jgi:hypothetical protein